MRFDFKFRIAFFLLALMPVKYALTQAGPPMGEPPVEVENPPASVNKELEKEEEKKLDAYGKDSATEINVKNADITAIIKIFSRKTKRNYILDENVKGKVSIYLPSKVSSTEAIRILDAVLALKGFTCVPIGENIWKIVPIKTAKQSTIPTITSDAEESDRPTAQVTTRLLRLKYVKAEDMQKLLNPLVSAEGLMNAYTGTNSLILIDSEDNIKRIAEIVRFVDIPATGSDMTIIPIKNADAKEVADKLKEILGDEKSKDGTEVPFRFQDALTRISAVSNPTGGQAATGGGADQNVSISSRARAPKIIPDDRTNSVIVVADEDTTNRIRALISKLDSSVDLSGYRFYVYRCQHASADELADVLSGLTGGSSGTSSSSRSGNSLNSNGGLFETGDDSLGSNRSSSSGRSSSRSRSQSRLSGQTRTPGQSRSKNNRSSGSRNVSIGDDTSITADPATNSLIIYADKTQYEKIKELLKQLDIKRRQVLVEAVLLEVAITNREGFGTEFLSSSGGKDGGVLTRSSFGSNLSTLLSDPTRLSNFTLAAASAGSLTLPGGITIPTQTALITAVKNNNNVNVLSSPTIMAADNEQAEIVVGENVPFLSSTSSNETNLNNTFNQIDRQDVGITLRLTPQISSGNFVTLKIFTEVSSVVPSTADSALGPTTNVRTTETTVITKNNQMVAIGGLISDDTNNQSDGIPYLKDVPLFGLLFKNTQRSQVKRNLLIFITPRIIGDQFEARDETLVKADLMRSDIEANQMSPDRSELLQSEDLDRVSEAEIYEGPKPSTIRGHESNRLARLNDSADIAPNERLKIKASLKLPSPANPAVKSESRFVVLKLKGQPPTESNESPFNLSSSYVGVIIPEESSPAVGQFFASKELFYSMSGTKLHFELTGAFSDIKSAQEKFAGLEDRWHILSPYEIMNLGQAPWSTSNSD